MSFHLWVDTDIAIGGEGVFKGGVIMWGMVPWYNPYYAFYGPPFGRGWWWRGGLGWGRGFGRRFWGRGFGWRWFAPPYGPYSPYNPYYGMSAEDEINMLKDEAEMLKEELNAIEKKNS